MDLPEKGSHCALPSCQTFDLLPIRCTACGGLFCREHALRDAHMCEAVSGPVEPASTVDRIGCQVEKCGHPALMKPAVGDAPAPGWSCDSCRGIYCISHRHTDTHRCVAEAEVDKNKKAEAQALLSKLFPDVQTGPRSSGSTSRARPTDPAKLAKLRAIELMKMKHQAVAADPSQARGSGTQAGDKIHLRIVYAPGDGGKREKVVWYRKDIVTGKAVDLAARALQVSREDGRGIKFMGLENSVGLGMQVEEGEEVLVVKEGAI